MKRTSNSSASARSRPTVKRQWRTAGARDTATPAPGRAEPLSERAYRELEELIVTLQLPPGTVYLEAQLSARLGIGRTPVRDALQRLARERLVRIVPRLGIVIAEINVEDQLKLLEVRRELERFLARSAARRATPAEREAFLECARRMRKSLDSADVRAFARADAEFNRLMITATRNDIADDAMQPLRARARRYWYMHSGGAVGADMVAGHVAIAEAIAAGRPELAAKASDALMDLIQDYTRASMPGF